jgi:hypothetical protein
MRTLMAWYVGSDFTFLMANHHFSPHIEYTYGWLCLVFLR